MSLYPIPAAVVAESCLNGMRALAREVFPTKTFANWMEGRASACLEIEPSIETLSAKNEVSFLLGYYQRHGVLK